MDKVKEEYLEEPLPTDWDDGRETYQMEMENRIKNLIWTVSGDYSLETKVNVEGYLQSKDVALYDGIKQGAFARYFDKEALSLYLVKKVFLQAQEEALVVVAQLCIEVAITKKITVERPGVSSIRRRAFGEILDREFEVLSKSPLGRLKAAMLREGIQGEYMVDKNTRSFMTQIYELDQAKDTMDIIRVVDSVYNHLVDTYFERRVGGLDVVLAVTMEDLTEFSWQDYLSEEMYENALEAYLEQMTDQMTVTNLEEKEKKDEGLPADPRRKKVVLVDEESLKKVYTYVELNYGRTYLDPVSEKRVNFNLCKGIHGDCGLYYTEGILKNPVKRNYQLEYARRQRERNKHEYYDHHREIKANIRSLTDTFQKSLNSRMEEAAVISDRGMLQPSLLWKVGRTRDARLFRRELKNDSKNLIVDILIDASGSQRSRQGQVAIQAYEISEALSNVGIPHRVMSFCTFWDYTILHRFRDYEDSRDANENIFEYITSSNNRDGLAIKAVADDLLSREEDQKILIILSDGKPYDVMLNRPNARNPQPYQGKYAIRDTGLEVRRLRNLGVAVLGVFAGEEEDLDAEKKIFGKDFAYIHKMKNFADIVGRYLKKQLENEA